MFHSKMPAFTFIYHFLNLIFMCVGLAKACKMVFVHPVFVHPEVVNSKLPVTCQGELYRHSVTVKHCRSAFCYHNAFRKPVAKCVLIPGYKPRLGNKMRVYKAP